ncbi:MAG: V-type ATPase subunit, partial [Pseudomonadota bacterium]|nr:V-type ATPase subunit [Pseudomonadota bacterium]
MNHYAYLNARISVLSSRLFSAQHFEQLLEQPLEQITLLPQNEEHNFNDLLTETDTAVIEKAWLMHMLTDFQVLIRSLGGIERDILMYWFQKCDIANLKTIVRGKMAGLNTEAIKERLLAVAPLTTLPVEQLLTTEDV